MCWETRSTSNAPRKWVLQTVEAMLSAHPNFKPDAVTQQMGVIRGLVEIVEAELPEDAGDWKGALLASAKAADYARVCTDHPDFADELEAEGIEFVSSNAWMVEQTTPPPPPPPPKKD